MAAASTIVCRQLTLPGLAPSPLSLRQLLTAELAPGQPLLLIVTPGADPSVEVADLAEATVGRSRLQQVAMGQGQAEAALKLLRECAASGEVQCCEWSVLLAVVMQPPPCKQGGSSRELQQ
jgi:dynein heavy chain 2